MPNRLITCASIILCLSLFLGVLVNYEAEPVPQQQRQLSFAEIEKTQSNDWQAILLSMPQYKKLGPPLTDEELAAQAAALSATKKQATISDSLLIGVIVDKPRSVLLFIQNQANLEPIQLTVGQSWLANWQLSEITPDSAVWINTQTQQTYTQLLFSNAEQSIDPLSKTSNEIK